MSHPRFFLSLVLVVLTLVPLGAQTTQVPFHRGVNLTGWFQAEDVRRLPFSKFGPRDFLQLLDLGVDGVRLPVNFVAFVGPGPEYRIDPRLFPLLDQAVDGLLAAGLAVVIDNHGDPLDPRVRPKLEGYLKALWSQLARHYRDRSARLLYEIQNEPHNIAPAEWARIQKSVIDTIRQDDGRTVVVTGADWGGEPGMEALPTYADPHLIYTFHDYDPFLFTHQGADWAQLQDLKGVVFPPRGTPPRVASSLQGGWVPGSLRDYYRTDPVPALAATLDRAAAFSRDRGVPVWCGEFGVYSKESDPADRVAWYRLFRGLLDQRSIPWTMWDYKGGFGLFTKGSAEAFDQDLNLPLVEALGFTAPPQLPPGPRRLTTGFVLYGDGGGEETEMDAWGTYADVDFYDIARPAEGTTSLKVGGLARYGSVSWTFAPRRDLTALVARGVLSFQARSTAKRFSFDLRFVDGDAPGTDGLPWRMDVSVDQNTFPGDGAWHRVDIPLADLREGGAWDGTWHDPRPGSFDWTRVAGFQIVAEQADLRGVVLGFDDLRVR